MIVFDIETIPNPTAINSRQWQEYKVKKALKDDSDAALHPAFLQVVCICAINSKTGIRFSACGDEKRILSDFREFAKNELIFAGHFIKGYDIPVLCFRWTANSLTIPHGINPTGKKPWEQNHFDTAEIVKFGGATHISLDAACLAFGIKSPKEGTTNAHSVLDAWNEGRYQDIEEYCLADVMATVELIDRLS